MLASTVISSPDSLIHPCKPFFSSPPSRNHHRYHLKTSPQSRRRSILSKSSPEPPESTSPSNFDDAIVINSFEIDIENVDGENNRRRIRSRIAIDAELETVWRILTDYEGLSGFIPSLAVSQLLDKKDNFAKLYQVGEQNLGLGLKFNAKGVLDCYEGDLEVGPLLRRRDIEFKMVEGDFMMFEGRWSIEQIDNDNGTYSDTEFFSGQEFQTTLSYVVELEPKLWLPVRLIEGRICRDVKTNLQCIREEAQRVQRVGNQMPFDLIP